jgi:hypothetical protein
MNEEQVSALAGPSRAADVVSTPQHRQVRSLRSALRITTSVHDVREPAIKVSTPASATRQAFQNLSVSGHNKRLREDSSQTFDGTERRGNGTGEASANAKRAKVEVKQTRTKKTLRWKSEPDLAAIKLYYKSKEEEEFNSSGISHEEEGNTLRKSKTLLEWYKPWREC